MFNPIKRPATVLLIVLIVLSIFASIGLAFILYAEGEANSSRTFREAADFRGPDVDPELAFASFLQQLIFDCKDDASGVFSALRGHSMLRNMYGLNYTVDQTGQIKLATDARPFNGMGRLHYQQGPDFNNADDYNLVNYTYFAPFTPVNGIPPITGVDTMIRDPERYGARGPSAPPGPLPGQFPGQFKGGLNPPYTAPDLNCMFLAAVQSTDPLSSILVPSFHRDWTGIGELSPITGSSPNIKWSQTTTDKTLKRKTLRPHPSEHPDFVVGGVVVKKGFPPPEDAGGDVANRPGSWARIDLLNGDGSNRASNDSIWIYTGAPVFTLPDGRKYTMLFAPLVIDLDGKININVAGNNKGPGGVSASNQGWGPWEINPNRVLPDQTELPNLYLGAKTPGATTLRLPGKYDATAQGAQRGKLAFKPSLGFLNPNKTPNIYPGPFFYAPVALNPAPGGTTPTMTLPTAYQLWPTHTGYDSPSTLQNLDSHPMYHSLVFPTPRSRVFPASEMYKILRAGGTNSDAMLGDLWQLLPKNLAVSKNRNLITPLSYDRREPGLWPWLNKVTATQYAMSPPAKRPSGLPIRTPDFTTPSPEKEYGLDWRGAWPMLETVKLRQAAGPNRNSPYFAPKPTEKIGAIDLNRPMVPAVIVSGRISNLDAVLRDRRQFASELYETLIKATGAYDPFDSSSTTPLGGQIPALRYLAQLAVNIVDFIDTDDIITSFHWSDLGLPNKKPPAGNAGGWVYGTEMPKVVINEVYCEYHNDFANEPDLAATIPDTQKFATYYQVDLWAELCNPFKSDPALPGGGDATLFSGTASQGYPVYRLIVTEKNFNLRNADNTDGRPDGQPPIGALDLNLNAPKTVVKGIVTSEFASRPTLKPLDGAFQAPTNNGTNSNQGFYLIGPREHGGKEPEIPFPIVKIGAPPVATINAKGMRYVWPIPQSNKAATPQDTPPTLLLQRLTCPYASENNDPASPTYNPFITVDYFEVPLPTVNPLTTPVNPAADYNGNPGAKIIKLPEQERVSLGRVHPYKSLTQRQEPVYQGEMPQHTFFYHNFQSQPAAFPAWPPSSTPKTELDKYPPFDWLVHLDRSLVSPMELLHVSAYAPHALTQQFDGKMGGYESSPGQMKGHQAPWFDSSARLHRFFEFVQTKPLSPGVFDERNVARLPGKININTVWDKAVFEALCDAQFDVGPIWDELLKSRNPGSTVQFKKPGPDAKYFLPLSTGHVALEPSSQHPRGLDIGNTILRMWFDDTAPNKAEDPKERRLLEPSGIGVAGHPYKRFELLNKIYNNITTRSNCFAVWVTVGFFEVNHVDPGTGRIFLGQEIGRADGRNVRHKMFAIIDRSVLDSNPHAEWPGSALPQGVARTFLPAANQGPNFQSVAEAILNNRMVFNPQSPVFKDLVPFFAVIE